MVEVFKKPRIIELPKIEDDRGNLSFIEQETHLPFEVKRVYWIYDVPGEKFRGGHAFRETEELVVALSGSFEVVLDDGNEKTKFFLNRSYFGVLIPPMMWGRLENFSTNSLALIMSSAEYDENDYIRDFKEFQNLRQL